MRAVRLVVHRKMRRTADRKAAWQKARNAGKAAAVSH
jgi:hypothetical protein